MVQVHEQLGAIDYYIGANVEVAPDVVIAAGVVLEAAPGARLVVASGVCVGVGVIVQAAGGKLVIGTGVSLGVGVLVLGQGRVNAHACIGAESTLLNPQVEAGAVIPAKSLLGVPDSPQSDRPSATHNGQSASAAIPDASDITDAETNGARLGDDPSQPGETENGHSEEAPTADSAMAASPAPAKIVYGRDQVTQLMKTLFPHRDALNNGDNANGDSA